MVLLAPKPRPAARAKKLVTVARCYSVFERFFPACGLLDYTEGIYHGHSDTPYEVAQQNQIQYVLNEVRCTAGLFADIHQTDGTYDYHLTSEEWLRRMQAVLPTLTGAKILAGALPYALRHPVQLATMLACMLGSQSWNWQFRGPSPPTQLLRNTWTYD